ncbi:MAG: hypothetical protein WBK55_09425 [Alphaproteobacteria bacterium]
MKFSAFIHLFFAFFLGLAILASACAGAQEPGPADRKTLEETLKNAPTQTPSDPNLYMDLPEEYIQEAQKYFSLCERTGSMSLYYNCKCLASKFLDRRIQVGPKASMTSIALSITGECADATKAAGYEYQECVKNATLMPLDIPVEEYCACYANTFAKLYERDNRSGPSSKAFVHFQTQAYISCNDPETAKKLFPERQAQ